MYNLIGKYYQNDIKFIHLYEFKGNAIQLSDEGRQYEVGVYVRTNKLGYNDERGRRVVEYSLDRDGGSSDFTSRGPSNNPNLTDETEIDTFVSERLTLPGSIAKISNYLTNRDLLDNSTVSDEDVQKNLDDCG